MWHIYKQHIHVFLITGDKRNNVFGAEVDMKGSTAQVRLSGMKITRISPLGWCGSVRGVGAPVCDRVLLDFKRGGSKRRLPEDD